MIKAAKMIKEDIKRLEDKDLISAGYLRYNFFTVCKLMNKYAIQNIEELLDNYPGENIDATTLNIGTDLIRKLMLENDAIDTVGGKDV